MDEPIRFRAMFLEDIDAVAAVEARGYEFPWSRGAFADCLEANHECRLAQLGRRTVGHGVLAVAAGEAQLLNVCIEPGVQGRGCGRALTCHLIERAAIRGAEVVFLEVRLSNRVAMALYRGLGFRQIGWRRNYYRAAGGREDAVAMALAIGAPLAGTGMRQAREQACRGTIRGFRQGSR